MCPTNPEHGELYRMDTGKYHCSHEGHFPVGGPFTRTSFTESEANA